MTHDTVLEPLLHDERALRRVFREPAGTIREWLTNGYLPARRLPNGRLVVLHDELIEMLRGLPRERAD